MWNDNWRRLGAFLHVSAADGAISQEGKKMWKKTLVAVTVAGGLVAAPMVAQAGDNRAAGAVAGGLVGALIGSSVNGGNGAVVGGLLGALAGGAIADSGHDHRYYNGGHYGQHNGYYGHRDGRYANSYRSHGDGSYRPYGERYPNGYTRAYNGGTSYST
jgi:hypothetical protein